MDEEVNKLVAVVVTRTNSVREGTHAMRLEMFFILLLYFFLFLYTYFLYV